MATIEFTGDGVLGFYGTNVLNDCVKLVSGENAEQILGLVPCFKNDTSLCTANCFTIPAFSGDFNSFLFEFNPSITTADFRLFKQDTNSTFVQVSILSSAEGTGFDLGFSSNYPNYAGFQLDWEKIFNLYGSGVYKFVVFDTDLENSLQSYPFYLREGTCENKDGTVYLEVTNIGEYHNWKYTKDNGLLLTYDLINLEWNDSCRYLGKVVNTELEQNIEEIKFANGREEEFYNSGVQNYDLNVFKCDFELFKRIEHYLKGKDTKITNDNLDREYTLIKQNVRQIGENTSSKFPKNKLLYEVKIKFKDEFTDKYKSC